MFAMLNGAWPRVAADGTDLGALGAEVAAGRASTEELGAAVQQVVEEAVRAQTAAGLDLVTDGSVRWPEPGAALLHALEARDTGSGGMLVRAWSSTAALADAVVAQAVPGPYSLGRRAEGGRISRKRTAATLALADGLAGELEALAAAGCALVTVEEPDAVLVGGDAGERELFVEAQRRLLATAPVLHAMLVVTGGSAWEAGVETILGAPYRSYLFDLVAGPANWRLVRAAPGDRGIVCGALAPSRSADQAPELVWAAQYAASSNARGPDRVGLANASSLAALAPATAGQALEALARAARLAGLPLGQAVAEGLDPRTIAQPSDRPRRPSRRGA
jgi:methionine synthase II (cobalamin-independent)